MANEPDSRRPRAAAPQALPEAAKGVACVRGSNASWPHRGAKAVGPSGNVHSWIQDKGEPDDRDYTSADPQLGARGPEVSAIGFGAWAIGGPHSRNGEPIGWGA